MSFIFIFSGEKTVKKQQMTLHEFQAFISNVSPNDMGRLLLTDSVLYVSGSKKPIS